MRLRFTSAERRQFICRGVGVNARGRQTPFACVYGKQPKGPSNGKVLLFRMVLRTIGPFACASPGSPKARRRAGCGIGGEQVRVTWVLFRWQPFCCFRTIPFANGETFSVEYPHLKGRLLFEAILRQIRRSSRQRRRGMESGLPWLDKIFPRDVAVGQHQWDPLLVGRCTTHSRTDFCGDWDVHWGYGVLTHSHVTTTRRCTLGTLNLDRTNFIGGGPARSLLMP